MDQPIVADEVLELRRQLTVLRTVLALLVWPRGGLLVTGPQREHLEVLLQTQLEGKWVECVPQADGGVLVRLLWRPERIH